MIKYLKQLARNILKDEIEAELIKLKESRDFAEALSLEKKKIEKQLKQLEDPESIILKYYRIDNVDENGFPPSYLDKNNPTEYMQRVQELESVFRNKSFRELIAWSLNFHANMSVSEKLTNRQGEEIVVSSEKANNMIKGVRSIWDLIVGAHNTERKIQGDKKFDKYALMDLEEFDE